MTTSMNGFTVHRGRREFLRQLGFVAALATVPGLFAEELLRTPRMTEGPFYPNHLPLDTDNDLVVINDALTSAVGQVTHLSGRLLDGRGDPIRNALIEIWQVDGRGVYLHTASTHAPRDPNFQGFGRFLTGSTGEYYFRTIKPVPYPGRTPHIHFAVKRKGLDKWTTQCFLQGESRNAKDRIYQALDAKARQAVTVEFAPVQGSRVGELSARFDLVLGHTPEA